MNRRETSHTPGWGPGVIHIRLFQSHKIVKVAYSVFPWDYSYSVLSEPNQAMASTSVFHSIFVNGYYCADIYKIIFGEL